MNLAFVIAAGGRGARFGGDKLAERLGRETVLEASLAPLESARPQAPLVVVVPAERLEFWQGRLPQDHPRLRTIVGGPGRQESVQIGVRAAADHGADVVAIHDAARPLVDPRDVEAVVQALGGSAAAILTTRIVDTVKRISSDGLISETLPREDLRCAQTPQVFRVEALEEAWRAAAPDQRWTDEAMLLERIGIPVRCVEARHPNPKLTDSSDLVLLRALVGTTR